MRVVLGDVASIERSSVKAEEITEGSTYVGLEHIQPSGQITGFGSVAAGEIKSAKFKFSEDHVLFGKLRPNLGKVADPDFSGICSTDILPVRPGPRLDRRFLFHYLRLPSVREEATKLATGANLPRLKPQALAEFEIPLLSMEEQKRIAAILDAADNLRTKRRQALTKLDTLTHATFRHLFADPYAVAEKRPLGYIADLTVGHVGPTSEHFCEHGVPFLRTGNIGDGRINWSGLRHITPEFHARLGKSTLHTGDLAISRVISDRIRGAEIPPELDGANCANVVIVRPGPRISAAYLLGLLGEPSNQSYLLGRKVGSAQSVVNTGTLKQWEIHVPDHRVLSQFEANTRAIRAQADLQAASLERLEEVFSSLQQRAFRGEL